MLKTLISDTDRRAKHTICGRKMYDIKLIVYCICFEPKCAPYVFCPWDVWTKCVLCSLFYWIYICRSKFFSLLLLLPDILACVLSVFRWVYIYLYIPHHMHTTSVKYNKDVTTLRWIYKFFPLYVLCLDKTAPRWTVNCVLRFDEASKYRWSLK